MVLLADATIRDQILTPIDGSPEILQDGHYVWEIEDWQALPKRAHSEVFEIGGYKWYVILQDARSFTRLTMLGGYCYFLLETTPTMPRCT